MLPNDADRPTDLHNEPWRISLDGSQERQQCPPVVKLTTAQGVFRLHSKEFNCGKIQNSATGTRTSANVHWIIFYDKKIHYLIPNLKTFFDILPLI